MQDQLAETKEKYRMASGGVQERTKTLAEVSFIAIEFCKKGKNWKKK